MVFNDFSINETSAGLLKILILKCYLVAEALASLHVHKSGTVLRSDCVQQIFRVLFYASS